MFKSKGSQPNSFEDQKKEKKESKQRHPNTFVNNAKNLQCFRFPKSKTCTFKTSFSSFRRHATRRSGGHCLTAFSIRRFHPDRSGALAYHPYVHSQAWLSAASRIKASLRSNTSSGDNCGEHDDRMNWIIFLFKKWKNKFLPHSSTCCWYHNDQKDIRLGQLPRVGLLFLFASSD